jgi:excinuclease ABC subunit C
MSEGDERPNQPSQLRDAEIEPQRKPLAEVLERLPTEPGVYLMKDCRGKMLYIGKAANLRNRVRQYFQPASGDTRDFVPLLEGVVADIDTMVTSNEKEALLLENTLIKRHQPRFNVKLTDDKNFLSLRLDPRAEWPRLEVVRRMADDGAWYFGPYHSASACREALRVVNRHFRLRTCTNHVLHHRSRPCLQCQISRCLGPCCVPVSRDEYAEQVRDVRLFLQGKNDELLAGLRARMQEAARQTQFERASTVRDQIQALETVLQSQRVVSADPLDQDVVGFCREGMALEVVVLSVRQGKMIGSRAFSFARQEFPDAEVLSSFLGLYYDLLPVPPDEVLLPFAIADADLKADWLSDRRGKKVQVLVPARGPRHDLVELARKNAAASFVSRRNAREDAEVSLGRLQRRLGLAKLPRVIECYDISHIQGAETVASLVVFVDGQPDKSRYRTYKIRQAESPDDFACMYEVLARRFRRARESAQPGQESWRLPDLLVVDGGKGQLGVALAAARDTGIDVRPGTGLPIIALAKERDMAGPAQAPHTPGEPKAEVSAAAEGAEPPIGVKRPQVDHPLPPGEGRGEGTALHVESCCGRGHSTLVTSASGSVEASPSPPSPSPGGRGVTRFEDLCPRITNGHLDSRLTRFAPMAEPPAPPSADRKARARTGGSDRHPPDRVFLPQAKDAIPIRAHSAEMFVLQRLRDEAHRFAVTFHRSQRKKRTLHSELSLIPGIGPARQRDLLRHFGSLKKIREASLEELLAAPGITRKVASTIRDYFA